MLSRVEEEGQPEKEPWLIALEELLKPQEKKQLTAAEKREKKADERLMRANGGFLDWVYSAGNLVTELIEVLEEESFGLQSMLNAARESARGLDDALWQRFQEYPRRNVHAVDRDVITELFSGAEPQWRTLLTTPKKGGICCFLHVGTEPPSLPICEFLTKLGWFGVVVSPKAPSQGNEDRIQHVELDPFDEDDEKALMKLQVAAGSLVPKPTTFALAFADVVWDEQNMGGANVDPKQNPLWKQLDFNNDGKITAKEFRQAQKAGVLPKDIKFKSMDVNGDGAISQAEFLAAMRAGLLGDEQQEWVRKQIKRNMPMYVCGYGKLGVTMDPDVRWRLRIVRNIVSVSLQRLANQGSLVITWHGIPHHPALMFLTAQLRPVFLRVHVLVPEGTKSWEVYILAASFKRQEAEEVASKGGGGFMFKNFIDGAYRDQDLDDALMWSLPKKLLMEEYRLGGGDRTIAKGYNELWTEFAKKFGNMAKEIAELEIKSAEPLVKKKLDKPPPKEETKDAKSKAKSKAKAKAQSTGSKGGTEGANVTHGSTEGGTEGGTGEGTRGSGTGGTDVTGDTTTGGATKPGQKSTTLPQIGKGGGKGDGKGIGKGVRTSGQSGGLGGEASFFDDGLDTGKPKKNKFVRHRSMPSLACSLGSVVGVKKGFPDETKMAESYPIIARALKHLEVNSEIVARIDRDDIAHAIEQTSTLKYRATAEGKRAGDLEIVMPPEPPATKEQILKSLKEARKVPPPPKPL